MAYSKGIKVKKQFGQHFLRDPIVVAHMIEAVSITKESSIFEIGCGDGFLTKGILALPIARLWIFEIDPEWANYVKEMLPDPRLTVYQENFLDVNFDRLKPYAPWIVLANLPYQVTFPILHRFQEHRALLQEGVVMVQEEVAQKIVKTSGKKYGSVSLFFQWYFELKLLDKIAPDAFFPPPKVFSRLLYFKPKKNIQEIPNESEFWVFVKKCFAQPRRMLRNNLKAAHVPIEDIPEKYLELRAQQMTMNDFLSLWQLKQRQ